MSRNPLGEKSSLPDKYDPKILYPIPRWPSRSLLDIDKKVSMHGFDYWHAYELSWLNKRGKPQVAIGKFFFDARSENIVESKSFKLYLNSLNNERFGSVEDFSDVLATDLKSATSSEVKIIVNRLDDDLLVDLDRPRGSCIDRHDIAISDYSPDGALLKTKPSTVESTRLYSDLFRSNCPITGQPDWATFMIEYTGSEIEEASLLTYICSFRNHQSYHEECAELIFRDIMVQCQPDNLVIGLNYTRRGGLDINPFRSNQPISPQQLSFRMVRQ